MKPAIKATAPTRSAPRLTEDHRDALVATDVFFGGFCVVTFVLAIISAVQGDSTWRAPVAIFIFLIANVVVSQISLRVNQPYRVEILRAVVGAIIVPMSYTMVDGPLAPWWPGAIIMSLGGAIVLGLMTQRPFWGRLLAVYYVSLLGATMYFTEEIPDWYEFAIDAGVLAMVGLLFAGIMSLLGQALHKEHERSVELARTRDALFAEMEVAQEIQTLLLPRHPAIEGFSVFGRMVPASEVGGDYYDVLDLGGAGGRTFAAIGDVSGHGVSSGLTMMMARASLMGALEANPGAELAELYCTLNRCLCQNMKRMDLQSYMTFALLEHVGEGVFRAVGRHLPVLIHRHRTSSIDEVELQGAWLGMLEELAPEQLPTAEIRLEPGDTMVLYTDGILEHGAETGSMFGLEGLSDYLQDNAQAAPEQMVGGLLERLEAHDPQQEDDITLLLIKRVIAEDQESSMTAIAANSADGSGPVRAAAGE